MKQHLTTDNRLARHGLTVGIDCFRGQAKF